MKKIVGLFLAVMMFGMVGMAHASAVLNPTTGGDYYFYWSGFDQIDSIYTADAPGGFATGTDLGSDWSITLATASTLDLATAWDGFVPGDVFGLKVDGQSTNWTSTYFDGSGYFHGISEDLLLTAGSHSITLDVLSGLAGGGAWASFSGTTPAVPEPSTFILFGVGLAGAAFMRRRNKV